MNSTIVRANEPAFLNWMARRYDLPNFYNDMVLGQVKGQLVVMTDDGVDFASWTYDHLAMVPGDLMSLLTSLLRTDEKYACCEVDDDTAGTLVAAGVATVVGHTQTPER